MTTSVEHASVKAAMNELEKQGFEIVRISPDSSGKISCEEIVGAVDETTCLVSMMMVNNETGYILPQSAYFRLLKGNSPNV